MHSIVVRNQAGRRYETLAARLNAIADETLPLVEDITGLPLPDPVVIRLIRPRAWRTSHARRHKRLLSAETIELSVPWTEPAPGHGHHHPRTRGDGVPGHPSSRLLLTSFSHSDRNSASTRRPPSSMDPPRGTAQLVDGGDQLAINPYAVEGVRTDRGHASPACLNLLSHPTSAAGTRSTYACF